MLSAIVTMFLSSSYLMLRLGSGVGNFPRPLSAQQEREYVQRCLQGDMQARNELIEHNLRLVAHIIKKYYTQVSDQDDLISVGTIGLIKGVATYKPDKGVRLATYASRCIENEILMYFRKQKKSAGELLLSDSIDTDDDGGNLSIMDVVCVEDDMLDRLSTQESCRTVREKMREVLTEREYRIISMRYGMDGGEPKTQREVAEELKISRSYVSRIEKRALEKLRETVL